MRINLQVSNSGNARVGTVRIFYAPKFNEQNTSYILREQKSLFVELDRFTTNCNFFIRSEVSLDQQFLKI